MVPEDEQRIAILFNRRSRQFFKTAEIRMGPPNSSFRWDLPDRLSLPSGTLKIARKLEEGDYEALIEFSDSLIKIGMHEPFCNRLICR